MRYTISAGAPLEMGAAPPGEWQRRALAGDFDALDVAPVPHTTGVYRLSLSVRTRVLDPATGSVATRVGTFLTAVHLCRDEAP